MADTMPPISLPSPSRKRDHQGHFVTSPSRSLGAQVNEGDDSTNNTSCPASPAPSTLSSALTELTSTSIVTPDHSAMSDPHTQGVSTGEASAKKRKLTFAEKEVEKAVKKREKEERDKRRSLERARKDEEKRVRDEEKRQKEEDKENARRVRELEKAEKKKAEDAKRSEREEKKKIKDVEKQEKEAEKAKQDAERLKKERSQMRIGAFFGRPAQSSTPPVASENAPSAASSRRSSIASVDVEQPKFQAAAHTPSNPDFEKFIIPYFVHENTEMAPINRFVLQRQATCFDGAGSDFVLEANKVRVEPLSIRFPKRLRLVPAAKSVREVVESSQISGDSSVKVAPRLYALDRIPLKVLSFREDIRPPYMGTYSGHVSLQNSRRMARNPTYRGRTDTNYDYDSEAEWEPPADDDDDINLDDDLSDEEEDEEDMADFLDDENDAGRKRLFMGEMEPVSTGLCWQGKPCSSNGIDLQAYKMGFLHDSTTFPIDPFSTVHWSDEGKTKAGPAKAETDLDSQVHEVAMPPPPRHPLTAVSPPNALLSFVSGSQSSPAKAASLSESKQRGRPADPSKPIKLIQPEFLPAFKQAVSGSDLTKAGLVEILKKQFPKCAKDAIKDTIGAIAVRVGKKESEKKWQLID